MLAEYYSYVKKIEEFIENKRIFTDPLHTYAYGTDASFYRLTPQVVIKAINESEVSSLVKIASQMNLPVTFRAGGTSLSGQGVTDSILIVCAYGWEGHEILNEGSAIKLQPGVIGSTANMYLKRFNRKIGPDPASINAAMIGGIASNNASGMCCGVAKNSYNTLKNMKVILHDGTLLDTSDKDNVQKFKESHRDLLDAIKQIRSDVFADESLRSQIERKFSIKNTTGYSLNALIDYEDEIDILTHLMIGSEGTLGFISEITYDTVKEEAFKASTLPIFDTIEDACKVVAILKKESDLVNAVELMDRAALKSVEDKEGIPQWYKTLSNEATALLIQVADDTKEALDEKIEAVNKILEVANTVDSGEFTSIPSEYQKFWNIRKGLFPTVGAMREVGTTVIIEDVAFPIDSLAPAMTDLIALFKKHNYNEAIIFGHALEGNVHFVFTQDFSSKEEVERYSDFMDDVSEMVTKKYDGSLKAEHGTGRNMAPFVEMEWGEKAHSLMKKIKNSFDPQNILNPGVIINDDKEAHIKDLKSMPATDELVDKCIECGFCEPRCPSRELTLTPRQRIALNRKISGDGHGNRVIKDLYFYEGDATCAADGLCATSCPVGIDTGKLTKRIREKNISVGATSVATFTGKHFDKVTSGVRAGLKVHSFAKKLIGRKNLKALLGKMRDVSGNRFPYVPSTMPEASPKISEHRFTSDKKVVYFPSCVSRTMGGGSDSDKRSINQVTLDLLEKAGFEVVYPENVNSLCCGVPYESKGIKEVADDKLSELESALIDASHNGEYPILFDTSPCTYRSKMNISNPSLKIYEPISFAKVHLLPNLEISKTEESIAVHVTCSSRKMGVMDDFITLANELSSNVIVPEKIECCGFAGDRGFNYPELNASALKDLKKQVEGKATSGYSTSKTCEIGLSEHSEIEYKSIYYLLDRQSS